MVIQIDSREKDRAIRKIVEEFDRRGVKHPVSKLMVGDYMNYDNPRLIVDRKQNLSEVCSNVCQGHERFRNELKRAQENEIRLIILVEHGRGIHCLEDVIWWNNPRGGKSMQGEVLYKVMKTQERKYGIKYLFCDKRQTGRRIIEILSGGGLCHLMK